MGIACKWRRLTCPSAASLTICGGRKGRDDADSSRQVGRALTATIRVSTACGEARSIMVNQAWLPVPTASVPVQSAARVFARDVHDQVGAREKGALVDAVSCFG